MISIIVPVYNAQERLDRCVQSILCQSYDNWELLLVNDGSLDKSGIICEDWSKKDKRIKVFHKKNGGVSSARNLGLDKATGEWVTFIDADDTIHRDTLKRCSVYFTKAEIIRFSMKYIYSEDGSVFKDCVQSQYNRHDYLLKIVARESILGVCGGIYLRDLFSYNNIRFDTSLINGEDWLVLFNLVNCSKEVTIIPDVLYYYDKTNEGSCTNESSYTKSLSALKALYGIYQIIGEKDIDDYNVSVAKAKCDLCYYFYAGIVCGSLQVSQKELKAYTVMLNIKRKDVLIGTHSIKKKMFLLFVTSKIGMLFMNIITY